MMATLRGHDSIVKELILTNCDVNLHCKVYYSDLASSLNMTRMIWSMALFRLVMVSGVWMPHTRTDGLLDIASDSIASSVSALMLSGVVAVGVLLVLGSGIEALLGSGVFAAGILYIVLLLLLAVPVISVVVAILMVMVLVVVASMYREFIKTMVLCMCVRVVLQFVMFTSFVWSLRDVAIVGAVTVIATVVVTYMVQKGMMAALQKLVVTVLGLANLEIYVISVACVQIARKVFGDGELAWVLVDQLSVGLFIVIPLVVLGTQKTAVEVIIRGAVVLFGFVAATMYKMENVLVPLEDMTFVLVLVVLVMARIVANIGASITKKSEFLKGMISVLHLVVAVAEVYLAVVISTEGPELKSWKTGAGGVVHVIVVIVLMTPVKAGSATALHYAAGHNRIKCGVLLVEAGGDVMAKNKRLYTPFEIGSNAFQAEVKQALSFTTKHVIAVIGNSEHGKSTLVAALKCTSDILWKKAVNHFKKVAVCPGGCQGDSGGDGCWRD